MRHFLPILWAASNDFHQPKKARMQCMRANCVLCFSLAGAVEYVSYPVRAGRQVAPCSFRTAFGDEQGVFRACKLAQLISQLYGAAAGFYKPAIFRNLGTGHGAQATQKLFTGASLPTGTKTHNFCHMGFLP